MLRLDNLAEQKTTNVEILFTTPTQSQTTIKASFMLFLTANLILLQNTRIHEYLKQLYQWNRATACALR